MPHALLLSPDDQAVSAITAVLEEMSVTCERPLDGPSAAKKLSSQSFDLVLVDCENLPAAKLIFDVCRRAQPSGNPVPIAIVDGRAGLPTAFRLGAELILTKPVAKDQARTTIRTAVSRLKKDESARVIQPSEDAPADVAGQKVSETRAQAAAAAASSPSPADVNPPRASVELPVARMRSAIDEIAATPAPPRLQPAATPLPSMPASISGPSKSAPPLPDAPPELSEDPVLADLEAQADLPTPVFSSYQETHREKSRGSMVALLILALAGGGFYAAWTYQPGFREMAQPQIDRLLASIGTPRAPQDAAPVRSAPTPSPKPAPAPKPPATAALPASDAPASPAPADNTASPSTTSSDAVAPTPAASASETASPATPVDSKKAASGRNVIAAVSSDTELPGEKSAVILSSQGAEKRLLRHLQPGYPADARKQRIEGTVVLKTVVDEGGKVEGVRLIEGNPTLAAAAISAVKQWRYRPYLRDGKARPFQTIVLVEFQRP